MTERWRGESCEEPKIKQNWSADILKAPNHCVSFGSANVKWAAETAC